MLPLLLALTISQINVIDGTKNRGLVRTIKCSTGMSCPLNSSGWVELQSSGGGAAVPTCSGGQAATGNGSAFSCVSNVSTATALQSNPVDCSADKYATTIAANGDLTCSSVSDTGLANAYSGVGACSASHWASTLTRNSAPTCTQPNYTDLAGCEPGQGTTGGIQYNNAGCQGGLSNLLGDGTNSIYISGATPAAPSAGSTAYDSNNLLFPMPMRKDNFFGIPIPQGMFPGMTLNQVGALANWYSCSNYPGQWNSTSLDVAVGCNTSVLAAEGTGTSGGGWATTSLTTRLRRVGFNVTTGQTWGGIHRGNLDDGEWVGNAAGVGGFVMWTRFVGATHQTGDMTFVGVAATAGAFPNGSKPSQQKNTAYVGCDSTDTNLQVCSNDNTTTSCITTSASFPCRTNSTMYDVWLAYPPNSALQDGGTGFNYYIERLDSPANISGTKSSNLPQNTVQLTPHVVFGSPDGGTLTVKPEISGVSTWSNW